MRAPEFWTGATPAARACAALLSPLGAVYGLSVRLRKARAQVYRPKARVICVGNLTAGGSGKTPVAIALATMLSSRGATVFLTRGYGGRLPGPVVVDPRRHSAADIGDEPLLLAACATAIVARDRAAGARLADALCADFIVMDDGFQNFSIAKDLSLLVIDAQTGFGNGRLIPAGPLRESVPSGFCRADALVLVGDSSPEIPVFRGPVLRSKLIPEAPEEFRNRKIIAFAGIGRPRKFFDMLVGLGAELVDGSAFPDHHRFSAPEITALKRRAKQAGAMLVTTGKDYVRLDPPDRSGIIPVPVRAGFDDSAAVEELLASMAQKRDIDAG